jgi:transposase
MIDTELLARIRHLFYAEHWKIGTIASQLQLHHDTVRRALRDDDFGQGRQLLRPRLTDPYQDFVRNTLERYPNLRATRIFEMARLRGYPGSVVTLRRLVAALRPRHREVFLRLRTFPGEQAQVDWGDFGKVQIGRAERRLSCLALTLSFSRALYLEFFFDQSLGNFLRGHVRAFNFWGGCPRNLLYDNLKSVVLERFGDAIRFHPRLLELAAHYHFAPKPCHVRRPNEKGRIERSLKFVRESFFAARPFTTLQQLNQQARLWLQQIAHQRPWPQDRSRTVAQAFQQEKPQLLGLPDHPFQADSPIPVHSRKTIYVRFDRNDYSIPPEAVGHPLTLVASDTLVRILDGSRVVASHRRSYDRGQVIADPAHQQALLQQKRKAWAAAPSDRLTAAAPQAEAFLEAALQRGESLSQQTRQLLLLLEEYGAEALREALDQALQRETPRASSVAFLLQSGRRNDGSPRPVDLSRRPELAALDVAPHSPEDYDVLAKPDSDPESDPE